MPFSFVFPGMRTRSLGERFLDLVFPRTCTHCEEDLPPPLKGPLCGACLKQLRPFAGASARGPSGVGILACAYAYGGAVSSMIRAFKYGNRADVGRCLADWMAGLWPRYPELGAPDAAVCVPLHPRKLRFRGFNQAEILARAVARAARAPFLPDALRRLRNTPPQRGHSRRERLGRLRGAFAAPCASSLKGKRLLLIDDVATTGETLSACAQALRTAGAGAVDAYVLARKF